LSWKEKIQEKKKKLGYTSTTKEVWDFALGAACLHFHRGEGSIIDNQ